MQDKIKTIREKCILANPSIKDLVFGCKLIAKSEDLISDLTDTEWGGEKIKEDLMPFIVIDHYYGHSIADTGDFSDGKLFVQAFCMMGEYYVDLYEKYPDLTIEDDLEIIGRDIRLADVLYTIVSDKPDSEVEGIRLEHAIITLTRGSFGFRGWNYEKDSLDEQSEETINFIYNILQ